MAQTLRSQVFDQMNRDVQSGLNSINSSLQGIAQAKQAYDQGFYEKIGMQMDSDAAEFEDAAINTLDPDELKDLQAQYESKMQDYVNSLKAPKTVKEKWESTLKREYSQSLKKYADSTEAPRLWSSAKKDYDSQAKVVIANGDLNYSEKKAELERLWNDYKMGDAPYSIVGYVNTAEDYLKASESLILTQGVDRYYAPLNGAGTPNDFDAGSLADKLIADLESESGQKFDVSTRAEYKETILKKIASEESKVQEAVRQQATEMERTLDELLWTQGVIPDAQTIMEAARQYGAWSEETGISKYWQPYLSQYESILKTQIEYDTALQMAQDANSSAANLTVDDWVAVAQGMTDGYVPSKGEAEFVQDTAVDTNVETEVTTTPKTQATYSSAANLVSEDGTVNYNSFSSKETTLSFVDGSTAKTTLTPLVDAMANREGLVDENGKIDKTSIAYKSLVLQANTLGVLGYFSDGTKEQYLDILRSIKYSQKENGEYITDDEYRHVVISLIASNHLTKDDIEGAGLYDYDSGWSKLESSEQDSIKDSLTKELEVAWYGAETLVSKKNDKATVAGNNLFDKAKKQAFDMLEVTYNADPASFLANKDKILKEIAQTIGSQELQSSASDVLEKCMNNSFLFWGVGKGVRGGISEWTDTQELMEGIYNPGSRIDPDTGAVTYKDYTPYLVEGVLNAAMKYVNEQFTDLNGNGKLFSLETARNLAAQALSNGASNYADLGYGDKTAVDVCITKILVERDARDMLAKQISEDTGVRLKDIQNDAIFVTIPGFGVGMVYNGQIYASDGDVATKNVFKVPGTITEQAMKNITSAAPGKAVVNKKDITWGVEVANKSSSKEIWADSDLQVGGGR